MSEVEKEGRRGRRRAKAEDIVETTDVDLETDESDEERGLTPKKGYATVGRRSTALEEPERRGFGTRIREYVGGVRSELEKVSWPNREDVIRLTRLVLLVTISAAIILGLITFGFNQLFVSGIDNPIVFLVFGVVVAAAAFFIWRGNRKQGGSETFTSRL